MCCSLQTLHKCPGAFLIHVLKACENQGTLRADLCVCSTGYWALPQGCLSNLTFGISSIWSASLLERSLQLSPGASRSHFLQITGLWARHGEGRLSVLFAGPMDSLCKQGSTMELPELEALRASFPWIRNYHLKNRLFKIVFCKAEWSFESPSQTDSLISLISVSPCMCFCLSSKTTKSEVFLKMGVKTNSKWKSTYSLNMLL